MLRLGRPVGVYPRLEARLAAIHLGRRGDEEEYEEGQATGCKECGGESKPHEDDCDRSESDNGTVREDSSDEDCGCE